MTRTEYLESLPKDKDGNPIVDEEDFMNKEEMDWELEFIYEVLGICVYDYPEYYQV